MKAKIRPVSRKGLRASITACPKRFSPLEGAVKLHYAYVFPPDLSLFLLERKSFSLHEMFVDALEVEENFRLSGRLLG